MIQSHTATQEWQSFEMKMRRRRIERCLLRASVALEAGVLEDAAEALAEARHLDPNDTAVHDLAGQLASARVDVSPVHTAFVPAMADVPSRRSRVAASLAAISLVTLSGVGGWWWTSLRTQPHTPSPVTVEPFVQTTQASPPAPPVSEPSVRISETAVTVPLVTGDTAGSQDTEPIATSGSLGSGALGGVPAATPGPPATPEREQPGSDSSRVQTAAGAPEYAARPLLGGNSSENRADSAPPVPEAPAPAPAAAVVTATEGIVAPADAIKIAPPAMPEAAATPAAAPAAGPPDEQVIRGVLGRYEAAYSRLDAAAAGAVWPSVNQRALATAFEGLASQSISLGRCDVRVSGATALAQCSGSAQWTPKVGGGAQRASRQWRFDLRNNAGTWVITQATAR